MVAILSWGHVPGMHTVACELAEEDTGPPSGCGGASQVCRPGGAPGGP